MPAIKSRKKNMPPKICPSGIFWKTTGKAWKPRLKAPPWAMAWVSAAPKKMTAAGMAIVPPRTTSANSFVDSGREAVQGDILLLPDVGGVSVNDALAQAQGEEDLPGRGQPDRGRPQAAEVRIPDEAQSRRDIELRRGRVGGAQGQHPDNEDEAEDEQQGHAVFGQDLDALGDAFVEEVEVQGDGDEPKDRGPERWN